MKFRFSLLAIVSLLFLVAALPPATMQWDRDTRKIVTPVDWAEANAAEINAVVERPKPAKMLFPIVPPLGSSVTDFELKAMDGEMVYYYHSPDPAKTLIDTQIWQTRPTVRFTSRPIGDEDPRIPKVQGDTSIAEQTGFLRVWSCLVEIPYDPAHDGLRWVVAFMDEFDFFMDGDVVVWLITNPQDKFDTPEEPKPTEEQDNL